MILTAFIDLYPERSPTPSSALHTSTFFGRAQGQSATQGRVRMAIECSCPRGGQNQNQHSASRHCREFSVSSREEECVCVCVCVSTNVHKCRRIPTFRRCLLCQHSLIPALPEDVSTLYNPSTTTELPREEGMFIHSCEWGGGLRNNSGRCCKVHLLDPAPSFLLLSRVDQ